MLTERNSSIFISSGMTNFPVIIRLAIVTERINTIKTEYIFFSESRGERYIATGKTIQKTTFLNSYRAKEISAVKTVPMRYIPKIETGNKTTYHNWLFTVGCFHENNANAWKKVNPANILTKASEYGKTDAVAISERKKIFSLHSLSN